MAGESCAARELAAPLSQVGKAQDRVDQIVVRRQLECVHAGLPKRGPQRLFALFRDEREALAEAAVMRINDDLLSGLSQYLPDVVNHLTPDGRLPTDEEASRMV